ncbi:nuclear factor related to kappa-B-binding protein-like isoform X2 [Dreissena polymorpha]|nr:nuclear factor related to kappa-B-binding protein-like isoform X2 [Dreissena polymorpha]
MAVDGKWMGGLPSGKLERCILGNFEIQVPECFLEQKQVFNSIVSQETWNKVLTEGERQHLMTFLPKFPENDNEEKRDTLRKLFNGENIKFGNPLQKFHRQLKDGSFSPDIAKYTLMIRKMKQKEYRDKQKRYYHSLLKEILLSRQRVFEQLTELGPDEHIKFEYDPPKQRQSPLKWRAHNKYKRYLHEVHRECGLDDTSSEDEFGYVTPRSKKQLLKTLNPVPSPEPVTSSVHSTYAAKSEYANGDLDTPVSSLKRPRPISPPEVTEESYRDMLTKHRRRQLYDDYDEEEHPEYNTQNITLQDVMSRCQASRKGGYEPDDDEIILPPSLSKAKGGKKEKTEKRVRKKPSNKIRDMDIGMSVTDADDADDESKTNMSIDVTEDNASTIDHSSLPAPEDLIQDVVRCSSFFVLIKNIILNTPEKRISTVKLESRIRCWMDSPDVDDNVWLAQREDWLDQVPLSLKFLAGESLGVNMDQFVPYLDYKERTQQWQWIGMGRDSDEALDRLCAYWLKHKDDVGEVIVDGQESPPALKLKPSHVVQAATDEEKTDFQKQEKCRFEEPHMSFTYDMHGYKSVVGPVKGVFSKKTDTTKAREHALLVNNRPAYVTILTLVRDSVARLPNGEGTRGDICELLKDSQFLAPGITDAQINVVVSGALDRLHSEKDPCVRYDVNRKVWIYLHRNRTEQEFEHLHQAQAAAQKAKKSLAKPKTPKSSTPKLRDLPSSQSSSVDGTPSLVGAGDGVVEELVPVTPVTFLATPPTPPVVTRSPAVAKTGKQTPGGKAPGMTQSLTPAQLQLLQQAAAAQAAQKAQAEAAQMAKAQAHAGAKGKGSPSKADFVSKLQGQLKVISQPLGSTSVSKVNLAPPNMTLQAPAGSQSEGQSSASVQVLASVAGSPISVISPTQAGTNPLVARLMQQMSAGGQMVSVSSLLAAQRSLQQASQPRPTAFKIQGGNIVQGVSGKPLQLSGKPLAQAKGQLVQLGAKGQQTLGLIQTPQGTINLIPQSGASIVTLPKSVADSTKAVMTVSSSVGYSAAATMVSHVTSQPKTVTPGSGGMVVTQLTPGGNITFRPAGTVSQGKVIPQGQSSLIPTQLILQQTPMGLKAVDKAAETAGSSSLLVSSTGQTVPGATSLQMVRTVLSQQAGLKPGQATILISQQALQQGGQVLPSGQILQTARASGNPAQQGKQPMFARLITPQGNIKGQLIQTIGAGGQTISVHNESALRQTLSKLVSSASPGGQTSVILTTGGTTSSTISHSQQILAAAAAEKAALIREMEKEKKQ